MRKKDLKGILTVAGVVMSLTLGCLPVNAEEALPDKIPPRMTDVPTESKGMPTPPASAAAPLVDQDGETILDRRIGARAEFAVKLCLPSFLTSLDGGDLTVVYPFELKKGETGTVRLLFQLGATTYEGSAKIIATEDLKLEHGLCCSDWDRSGSVWCTEENEVCFTLYSSGMMPRKSYGVIDSTQGDFDYSISATTESEWGYHHVNYAPAESMNPLELTVKKMDGYGLQKLELTEGQLHLSADTEYAIVWDDCLTDSHNTFWLKSVRYTHAVKAGETGEIEVMMINQTDGCEYFGRIQFIADDDLMLEHTAGRSEEYLSHDEDMGSRWTNLVSIYTSGSSTIKSTEGEELGNTCVKYYVTGTEK